MYKKIDSFVNMAADRGGRGGLGGMVHGVRSLGSATLDLAYTAMGSMDIWWEGGCWEWCAFQYSLYSILLDTFDQLELIQIDQGRRGRSCNLVRSRGPDDNGKSARRPRDSTH